MSWVSLSQWRSPKSKPKYIRDRLTALKITDEIAGVMERLAKGENVENIVLGFRGRVSREAIAEAIQVVTTHFLEGLPISILHNGFLHESLK
jgi:hypothetical protein